MPLLLAFLKMLGTAAAKGAVGLGKAAVTGAKVGAKGVALGAKAVGKGAIQAGKWYGNRAMQGAKAGQPASMGELAKAFGSLITPSAEASEITPTQPMQYVPGPEGTVIGGQGEIAPGYEMQSPQSAIPSAYRNMAQAVQQPPQRLPQPAQQRPDVGFIRGMINATTGQPQPQGLQDVSQGRRTAYYAGGLIPNIMMSKLGQPSSAEAAGQQQQLESSQQLQEQRRISPDYQTDLQSAIKLVTEKGASEEEKIFMYQKLAAKYPNRSSEIKRIFFPQASDSWAETLGNIMNSPSIR